MERVLHGLFVDGPRRIVALAAALAACGADGGTELADASWAEDTPAAADASSLCEASELRCAGSVVQICQGGRFVDFVACRNDQVCAAGLCGADADAQITSDALANDGTGDGAASEVACSCEGVVGCGVDDCGYACGYCAGGTSCQDGHCAPLGQADTCKEMVACATRCGASRAWTDPAFDCDTPEYHEPCSCAELCTQNGLGSTVARFEAFVTCREACAASGDPFCALAACLQQEAACRFDMTGRASCADIERCAQGCPIAGSQCWDDCVGRGTPAAQAAFLGKRTCRDLACGQGGGGDPACGSNDGAPAACAAFAEACQ